MRIRCLVGLHHWEFANGLEGEQGGEIEVVRARCSDAACTRYGAWRVVDQSPYYSRRRIAADAAPEAAFDAPAT